jgi:hypothetical protein
LHKAIAAYRQTYSHRTPHVSSSDFKRFSHLCEYLKTDVIVRAVTDVENNVLATALFLQKKNRIYLIQNTTLTGGREKEANHFLLDQVIREFCGNNLTLDFEGSDIDGIAHFYMNFGSHNQRYYFFKHSHLPWPWRVFKK